MTIEQGIPVSGENNNNVSKPRIHIKPIEAVIAAAAGGLLGAGIAAGFGSVLLAKDATLLLGLLGGGLGGVGVAHVEKSGESLGTTELTP